MKAKHFSCLLSLPIALIGMAAIAQQVQEEICKQPKATAISVQPYSTVNPLVNSLMKQGDAAVKAKNYTQAEAIWRQLIQEEPKNAKAYYNLGEALRFQQKFEPAISAYRNSIEINPDEESACIGWAEAAVKSINSNQDLETLNFFGEKGLDALLECNRLRVKLKPDRFDFQTDLGRLLYQANRNDEAISTLYQAVDLMPCDKEPYERFGTVKALELALNKQSRLSDMLPVYKGLIRRYPDDAADYYHSMGDTLVRLNRLRDAVMAFRKSIELAPKSEFHRNRLKEAEQMLKSR
ncbi:tetratricopeptide repeat protein [Kovacikia minuta CCNUW1]|uniref:tetratricopeptide repeat protein n=1 Tax=Kovacikia minuta TaxID=2931930 RepID=UPI001CCC4D82|nr:tetratricopeptide repeat protein [Kovacikia minuta]UBF27448.1 tetratricopeptide repeat protein [Kovacikia minuta CCNUW1]